MLILPVKADVNYERSRFAQPDIQNINLAPSTCQKVWDRMLPASSLMRSKAGDDH
jgi:hypothetical protein